MEQASIENNWHYNPKLKDRARKLRSCGTKAEAYLWKYVLSKNKSGVKILRQRPILNFIVDFMCPDLKLIIEVDGITHLDDETKKYDTYRQKILESIGFKVLRFEDDVVLNNLFMVSTIVWQEIEVRQCN